MTWDDELERRKAFAHKKYCEHMTRANAEYVEGVRRALAYFSEGLPSDPDDELESLVKRVREHFGKDVFSQAVDRALTRTLIVAHAADDSLIPSGVLEEALRTELLRLARPH